VLQGSTGRRGTSLHSVPMTEATGQTAQLQTRICRPAGNAPGRLVVIDHDSPPNAAVRPRMQLGTCNEAARWFLGRGYGATGGAWAEGYGNCAEADYVRAGLETARDINAVADYATALPLCARTAPWWSVSRRAAGGSSPTTASRILVAAGGKADLEQPGPYDGDGHRLFFGPGRSAE